MVNKLKTPPRRRLSVETRREQILEAAYRVALAERLDAVTARRVAQEAGLSSGLVYFHFRTKARLVLALVDWVVDTLVRSLAPPADGTLLGFVGDRLQRLERRGEREELELFFDLWVLGTREPKVRARLRAGLERYRAAIEPLAREMVAADPARFRGVEPAVLAQVAMSFVHGCAVQAVVDAERFPPEAVVGALATLMRAGQGGDR